MAPCGLGTVYLLADRTIQRRIREEWCRETCWQNALSQGEVLWSQAQTGGQQGIWEQRAKETPFRLLVFNTNKLSVIRVAAVSWNYGYCVIVSHITSLVAPMVKCLPTMREAWIQSLGQEDSPEKETATHSSTLAWKIPWTKESGRLQSTRSQSWTRLSDFTSLHHTLNLYIFSNLNS